MMKKYMVILGMLLTALANAGENVPLLYQAEYLSGVKYFEQGQFQLASDSFRKAIHLEPSPRVEPDEYIPYIFLSATQFEIGNTLEARDALIQSQVYGVAPQTDTGKLLLGRYAVDIMSVPLVSAKITSTPNGDSIGTEAAPELVLHSEEDSVPARILRLCTNAAETEELPWYFHYQCGVELMKSGDIQRAVKSFTLGANAREDSARRKRTYGMWYIDYLPYYQLALAQSKLGDWKSALASIETSVKLGEFSPHDPDYNSFLELDHLIRQKLKNSDS